MITHPSKQHCLRRDSFSACQKHIACRCWILFFIFKDSLNEKVVKLIFLKYNHREKLSAYGFLYCFPETPGHFSDFFL